MAVAENREASRLIAQPSHEIQANAMRLARAYDVAKAECAAAEIEHVAVRSDRAPHLRACLRHMSTRVQRSIILRSLEIAQVAIDAAARGVQETRHTGTSHRLDHLLVRAYPAEIDVGFARCARDVGIRGQMNDRVMTGHRALSAQVPDFASHYAQALFAGMVLVVPFSSGGEIVVERHGGDCRISEKRIREMAPDKSSTSNYYVAVTEVGTGR